MVTEINTAITGAQVGGQLGGPVGAGIGAAAGLIGGIALQSKERKAFRKRRDAIRAQNTEIRKEALKIGRATTRTVSQQQSQFGAAGVGGAVTQSAALNVLRERYLDQARVLAGVDTAGANARSPKSLGKKLKGLF